MILVRSSVNPAFERLEGIVEAALLFITLAAMIYVGMENSDWEFYEWIPAMKSLTWLLTLSIFTLKPGYNMIEIFIDMPIIEVIRVIGTTAFRGCVIAFFLDCWLNVAVMIYLSSKKTTQA